MMLIKLAWRNLWRNKRRTFITAASIFFAVLLAIFMNALQAGAYERMIDNLVGQYMGYVQIHKAGYWEEPILDNSFGDEENPGERALAHRYVSEAIPRLEANALASSGNTTRSPRSRGKTVVTRKKTKRRNAISAIDALGISSLTFDFLFRIATNPLLGRA